MPAPRTTQVYSVSKTGTAAVDRNLEQIAQALRALEDDVVMATLLLKDKTIGTTNTEISHGLKRVPRGWIVVDKKGDARVWRAADSTDKYLILKASSDVIVSLIVF